MFQLYFSLMSDGGCCDCGMELTVCFPQKEECGSWCRGGCIGLFAPWLFWVLPHFSPALCCTIIFPDLMCILSVHARMPCWHRKFSTTASCWLLPCTLRKPSTLLYCPVLPNQIEDFFPFITQFLFPLTLITVFDFSAIQHLMQVALFILNGNIFMIPVITETEKLCVLSNTEMFAAAK